MAPTTRLKTKPTRRVNYRDVLNGNGNDNGKPADQPVLSHHLSNAGSGAHPTPAAANPPNPKRSQSSKRVANVESAANAMPPAADPPIPKTSGKKGGAVTSGRVTKKVAQPKPKPPKAKKIMCEICATPKPEAQFKIPEGVEPCDQFRAACKFCVARMINTKIEQRQLDESSLACPFDCGHNDALGFNQVKEVISKTAFDAWDKALLRHQLNADAEVVNCVNTACARPFYIDTLTKCPKKRKIDCPYCNRSQCVACTRPWHSGKNCKENADEQSIATMKQMGVKPCPQCGVQIKKEGGCDHMSCRQCKHNFCWICLVEYSPRMVHGEGCRHGHQDIANDPANFWGGPMAALNGFFQGGPLPVLPPQPAQPNLAPVPHNNQPNGAGMAQVLQRAVADIAARVLQRN